MTPPSQDATDIFSLTDHALADRLQFIKEVSCQIMHSSASLSEFAFQIGFGNWGSVWLCSPKNEEEQNVKLAVKLVHRSKTTTTAARVRSLYVVLFMVELVHPDFA